MKQEEAQAIVDQINEIGETRFCPITKVKCDKECRFYRKAEVKVSIGVGGVWYSPGEISCGLERH